MSRRIGAGPFRRLRRISPEQLGGVDIVSSVIDARGGKLAALDGSEDGGLADACFLGGAAEAESHAVRPVPCCGSGSGAPGRLTGG